MEQFLQHTLNATVLGGTFALLGIGLTLVFGIMRVVNFTHGELYTFGAYVAYGFVALLHVNFFLAIIAAAVLGLGLGAAIEILLLRRLKGADIDTVMLVMIGAWIALQNAEQLWWGGIAKLVPTPFSQSPIVIGEISVAPIRLFVLATAIALLIGFYVVINRTRLGMAMRATFQDRDTAALMGVEVGLVHTLTFGIGSALAAVAGALLGPIFVVSPTMGDIVGLKAFAIVILGGLGNIVGATIGGFALAFVEEFGAGYVSTAYRDALGFVVIIAVLALRPQGLFAVKERIG